VGRAAILFLAAACGDELIPPGEGTLDVQVVTTGSDLDLDGYTVVLDGGTGRPVAVSGGLIVSDLSPAEYSVTLTGADPNCQVQGENPRAVTVVAGQTVSTAFAVSCTTVVGALTITAATAGPDPDPDGYAVAFNGGTAPAVALGINGSVTLPDVAGRSQRLQLGQVAANCTVTNGPEREVMLAHGGTVTVTFPVSCATALFDRIFFNSSRDGESDLYWMHPDGSSPTRLTTTAGADVLTAVSPSGTRIVIAAAPAGSFDLEIMNADGTGRVPLTTAPGDDVYASWSPDGTRIAFTTERTGNQEVFVMNADGTNPVNLTNAPGADWKPDWSPDGTRIVFVSDRDGNSELYVMNANGSGVQRLTTHPAADVHPDWGSNDRIVFASARVRGLHIWTVEANSSGLFAVTDTGVAGNNQYPAWSPDGSQITFFGVVPVNNNEIFRVDGNGANLVNLTNHAAIDLWPSWSGRR
jgi:dipeptidyl aminopeptidase/acylaminoacyl peptidase